MRIGILGCGYVGRALARRLLERGHAVRATTTRDAKLGQLAALGVEPLRASLEDPRSLQAALEGVDAVCLLAPPSTTEPPERIAAHLREHCPRSLRAFVYGSSTGVYGPQDGVVDEATPPGTPQALGQARLDTERALIATGLPVGIVRIAGVYGPGRTLLASLRRGELVLFDGAPKTSRIHVEDLARVLDRMLTAEAPPLVLATDTLPATTLEVARYTARLAGVEVPPPVPIAEAHRILSKTALELRLGGRRCRSRVLGELIGGLNYPTYREGVRASLLEEGVTIREPT